jgi:hypothetical protein
VLPKNRRDTPNGHMALFRWTALPLEPTFAIFTWHRGSRAKLTESIEKMQLLSYVKYEIDIINKWRLNNETYTY